MADQNILVLGRRDHGEAMRVAAGMTIFGHAVRLVLMTESVAETEANAEHAELLDLADIIPETTVPQMRDQLAYLDAAGLAAAMTDSDQVINI